jgi:hypothetical protein
MTQRLIPAVLLLLLLPSWPLQDCLGVAVQDSSSVQQPLAVALITHPQGAGSASGGQRWPGKVEGLAVQGVEEVTLAEADLDAQGEATSLQDQRRGVRVTLLVVTDPDGGVSEGGLVHLTLRRIGAV